MKLSLYPKTKRIHNEEPKIIITEKLDGSNLGFFNINNDLLIAQRNNVYFLSNIESDKKSLYKGLYQWLIDNGKNLKNSLNETSGVFGEWIGMGKLKYNNLDKRFYLFAKANISKGLELKNLYYNRDYLIYPFKEKEIPSYISIVPIVSELNTIPSVKELDELYEKYTTTENRNIEGFIIANGDNIKKYVRMKNGKLANHKS